MSGWRQKLADDCERLGTKVVCKRMGVSARALKSWIDGEAKPSHDNRGRVQLYLEKRKNNNESTYDDGGKQLRRKLTLALDANVHLANEISRLRRRIDGVTDLLIRQTKVSQ